MKKILSLLLVMTLVITMSASAIFAGTTSTLITDVAGTPYSTAVNSLVAAGIVNGYEDNTYRPENPVTRAEACKLLYETYITDKSSIPAYDAKATFNDIPGYGWASQYIGWCGDTGIVEGYGNGQFRPGAYVTVAEFLTMLIRAGGHEAPDMTWPADYIAMANDMDLASNLVGITLPADNNTASSRGNCAIMLLETGLIPVVRPAAPETDPVFKGFSGKAFGFVLENGKVLNKSDQVVDMITFQVGTEEYLALAKKDVDLESLNLSPASGLVCLQFSNGEITGATPVHDKDDVKASDGTSIMMLTAQDQPDLLEFYKVTDSNDSYIFYNNGTDVDYVGLSSHFIVYNCYMDGNELVYSATPYYNQIDEKCYFAAFTVANEGSHLVDIIVYMEPSEAAAIFQNNPHFVRIG